MLAVAKPPAALKNQENDDATAVSSTIKDDSPLIDYFNSLNRPYAVSVNLGPSGFVAHSSNKHNNSLLPR